MNIKIKIVLIAIALPIIIYFWPAVLGGDSEVMIVQGKSMLPTILPGSLILTKAAPEYQIDDIVAFTQREGRSERIVVHRIIDVTDRGFIIKGDNNPSKDPGSPTSKDILGKTVIVIPYVGDLLGALRNPVVLIITGVILAAVQMEQTRRKRKKEKLRRIRLGITKKPTRLLDQVSKKKPKKPNYTLFFGAIAFNIFTYLALLSSISSNIRPEGDVVTGFLFNMFRPTLASTIAFAIYFVFIFGLYFLAKVYEAKVFRAKEIPKTTSTKRKKSTMKLLLGKESNSMLVAASFLWILFILMSLYHLFAMGNDLISIFT